VAPTTSAPRSAPSVATNTTTTGAPVVPGQVAASTFIETDAKGRMTIVRLDDGKAAGVLTPHVQSPSKFEAVMHAPNGDLLLTECTPPTCGTVSPQYLALPFTVDVKTGITFAGGGAAVSPDGRRIATLVTKPNRRATIRSYDFATGRLLSVLLAVPQGSQKALVTSIGWSGDSQSLFVAKTNGLYVVQGDAATLPARPTVPNQTVDGLQTYFPQAAMLANGHAVAFESTGIEHTSWPGALVDIDVATGSVRTVMGSLLPVGLTCGTHAANVAGGHCELLVDNATIAARGNDALFNNYWTGQIWVYDGATARLIVPHAPRGYGASATW
jgi:hypothetical protein